MGAPERWTRSEMADDCEALSGDQNEGTCELLLAVTQELRRKCATCHHFIRNEGYRNGSETHPPIASCLSWRSPVPVDGSGFCHRWEPK